MFGEDFVALAEPSDQFLSFPGFDRCCMDVVGIIIIHYKEVLVPPGRGDGVSPRKIGSEELLELSSTDGLFKGISFDRAYSKVVCPVLFGCRWCGGLGTLFDLVHVPERRFNLGG